MSEKNNKSKEKDYYFGGTNLTNNFGPSALLQDSDENIPKEVMDQMDSEKQKQYTKSIDKSKNNQ